MVSWCDSVVASDGVRVPGCGRRRVVSSSSVVSSLDGVEGGLWLSGGAVAVAAVGSATGG